MAQPKPGAKTVRVTAENIVGHKKEIMQGHQELKLRGLWKSWNQDRVIEGNTELEHGSPQHVNVLRNQKLIVVLEITYIEDLLHAAHWVKQYMDYLIYLFL